MGMSVIMIVIVIRMRVALTPRTIRVVMMRMIMMRVVVVVLGAVRVRVARVLVTWALVRRVRLRVRCGCHTVSVVHSWPERRSLGYAPRPWRTLSTGSYG